MTIKTRLLTSSIISISAIVIIIAALVWSHDLSRLADENRQLASRLEHVAFEETTLRHEYLRSPEEWAKTRMLAKQGDMDRLLEQAAVRFMDKDDRIVTGEIRESHRIYKSIIAASVKNRERTGLGQEQTSMSRELEQRLTSHALQKSYIIVDGAARLLESSNRKLAAAQSRTDRLIVFLVAVVLATITGNAFLLNRMLKTRLARLREGTEIVAGGNLDFRIDVTGHDELGDLSRTFNEMTGKLKKSHAALEEEITERRRAEETVIRQVALLEAIIRIFRETPACENEEDVARICLKVAEDLTGSKIGFIGELNQEGLFDTTTLSDRGWDACQVPRPEAYTLLKSMPNRGINRLGLREDKSWIINNPASHPDKVEKPEGHPQLLSFLGVPLRYVGGITGMIALANKEAGYTLADQQDVEALSVAFVESLNRRRAEKKISELNEELKRHIQQAEAANKELEAFSYSVSHDLRAPLRHVTGFVELLNKQDQGALDAKSRHYLQVISEAAQKMGNLIDDILVFSRMGRAEMMKARVASSQLVKEVIDGLKEETEGRDIVWEIAPLPVVVGDAAMLRQVWVNLISNALKYTHLRPQARIEIGAVSDEPMETVFYIKDNGAGFDMKYVDKLFGLFQRLHDAEVYAGTGVGLANVQRIIHRHGGRVWAEGVVDGGALFRFSLPKS
jgi:signal transduction histidine kinase/HAMP domain-containing protein